MEELPRGLCHYTSGKGFLGIVDSKALWATHVLYLNDHSEYQLAFRSARSLLDQMSILRELSAQAPRLRKAFLDVKPIIRGRAPAIFVTSFSEEWDDLSQWRGYTPPGDGYALVFDPEPLKIRALREGWRLEKCLYGRDGQRALIKILQTFFEYYLSTGHDSEERAQREIDDLARDLFAIAPVVKDESFRSEAEWRLISPPINDMAEDTIKFRGGSSFLVPYVDFAYQIPDHRSIMHVNVGPGPNADLALQAVSTLIVQKGLRCGCGPARSPYRPW
ncbi:DUF2971 domain-containing protein [Mycobacterium simiae]|uniref:DUF2971 domain-containing protein n=1 Tax=Mycobacterium simiae TaxID=1784 RepID=UPI000CC542CE|nr:DUF2971 domain-containing protein [Mycobacterium simiae]PLV48022.1 hypothetical protein X011_17770 [Mycobacterium tuberculosis variant microti OV254]